MHSFKLLHRSIFFSALLKPFFFRSQSFSMNEGPPERRLRMTMYWLHNTCTLHIRVSPCQCLYSSKDDFARVQTTVGEIHKSLLNDQVLIFCHPSLYKKPQTMLIKPSFPTDSIMEGDVPLGSPLGPSVFHSREEQTKALLSQLNNFCAITRLAKSSRNAGEAPSKSPSSSSSSWSYKSSFHSLTGCASSSSIYVRNDLPTTFLRRRVLPQHQSSRRHQALRDAYIVTFKPSLIKDTSSTNLCVSRVAHHHLVSSSPPVMLLMLKSICLSNNVI